MNEKLAAAEARCILALAEGRTPSHADELPLIEEVRRVAELPEERLVLLAHLRRKRERCVAEALAEARTEARPSESPTETLDAAWLPALDSPAVADGGA